MEEAKKLALQAKEEKETASSADGASPSSTRASRRTTKKLIKTNTKTATTKGSIKKGDTAIVHSSPVANATMVVHSPVAASSGPSGTVQIKKDPSTSPAVVGGGGGPSGTVQIKKEASASPAAASNSPKQTMIVKNATVVKK